MASVMAFLEKHPLFEGLDPEALSLFAACAREVSFAPGEVVYCRGTEADRFCILISGEIALESDVPGKGRVVVETEAAGDVIGASWLFPPYRFLWDARARVQSRALQFDARCLRSACDENPHLGYPLIKRLARIMIQRMQAARLQSLDIYAPPAGGRKP